MKRRGLEEGAGDGEDSDKLMREDAWLAGVLAASVTGRMDVVCQKALPCLGWLIALHRHQA